MTYSKPSSTIKGGRRGVLRKKNRKTTKKQNWISFVTQFHKQQTKKNKNWSFKDSMKHAKKHWKKEKKMYGGSELYVTGINEPKVTKVGVTRGSISDIKVNTYTPDEESQNQGAIDIAYILNSVNENTNKRDEDPLVPVDFPPRIRAGVPVDLGAGGHVAPVAVAPVDLGAGGHVAPVAGVPVAPVALGAGTPVVHPTLGGNNTSVFKRISNAVRGKRSD